jgi:iron complex outermembrane receptor protein
MRFIISILILSTMFGQGLAQENCNLTIRGKIVHAENNEPIEAAYIWSIENEAGTISDFNGLFRISKLCPGTYTIKIQYLGHQDYVEKLEINSNSNYTFRMVAEDIALEGVDIHGHQEALITTNSVSSIYGEVLRSTRGQTLGESLRKIPGVNTYSSGSTIQKPVIHGLHSNRILILNNGVRLEGQQWGADHAPEIDPFIANEISVVKGAETVRFGADAMGGVILVNPAPLPVKAIQKGEVDLIGFSNGLGINAAASFSGGSEKIKGLGYRIQGSSKIAGNVQTPQYILDNTGVKELNFSGAIGYSSSRLGTELYVSNFSTTIGILSDSHTGNLSDLESIIENGRPFREAGFSYNIQNPKQEVDHQLVKAKIHYHLHNGSKLNFQYSFQRNHRQEFDRRRGELNERASLDMVLFTNSFDLSYNHQTRKNWDGAVGTQIMQQANSNIPGTGVIPLIPNFDMINLGFYAIEKFTNGPLELEGGLRFDHRYVEAARIIRGDLQERDFTFNNFSAFFGGVYALTRNLTFNSNLGSAWRPPNINEQFSQGLHHGLAAIEIGNPDFESEQSFKWLNTLNYNGSNLNIELTGYANRINNYIYLNPTEEQFVSLRGTFNVFEYLQTDANFYGTDLSVIWNISSGWEFFSRGSIVRARNIVDDTFLPFIPADRLENGIRYQFANASSKSNTTFSISNLAVARQNREPEFDLAPAPPGYQLWNIGAQTSIKMGKNKLNVGLYANNVFNEVYKDYMNRFRYFTHELGRNVLLKFNYEF